MCRTGVARQCCTQKGELGLEARWAPSLHMTCMANANEMAHVRCCCHMHALRAGQPWFVVHAHAWELPCPCCAHVSSLYCTRIPHHAPAFNTVSHACTVCTMRMQTSRPSLRSWSGGHSGPSLPSCRTRRRADWRRRAGHRTKDEGAGDTSCHPRWGCVLLWFRLERLYYTVVCAMCSC